MALRLWSVLTVALLLGVPGAAAANDDPVLEPAECPFALPRGQVEGQTVECGYLVVPENRADPATRGIRLAVAVFRSPGDASRPDPIVYLAGGPGASSLELLQHQFGSSFAPVVAANRDLILFDQRGVGVSLPALDCPASPVTLEGLLACHAELSALADLTAYNSLSSAADVNDLRLALGYQQVNLWGGSYGTRLALELMRDYPEGLRSVVLDAVYPPDVDLYLELPPNADRGFTALFEACAADAACSVAYPDLRGVFFETVAQLDARPAAIVVTNPLTGETEPGELNGTGLLGVLFQFLYVTELLPHLPRIIYDVRDYELGLVEEILGSFRAQRGLTSLGMQLSVQCHEEIAFSSLAAHRGVLDGFPELAPLFEGSLIGTLAYEACARWESGRAEDLENAAVTSDIPTLLMAGAFDPIAPPHWAERAARTLTAGQLFLYPGVGHGASATPCGRQMMLEFLESPNAVPNDACLASMGIDFATPSQSPPRIQGLGVPIVNGLARTPE